MPCVLAVLISLAVVAPVHLQRSTFLEEFGPTDLNRIVIAEMDSLERRFDIRFPAAYQPIVRVGLPESIPIERQMVIDAVYLPDSSIIAVSPTLVDPDDNDRPWLSLLTTLYPPSVAGIVDHELGHAYSDWTSRMTTGHPWPTIDSTTCISAGIGLLIQDEGISETFRYGPPPFQFRAQWWPVGIDSVELCAGLPANQVLSYLGGYQLVGTLVTKYGMTKTVDYIVAHPLVVDPQHIRRTVTAWYRQAERDLIKTH